MSCRRFDRGKYFGIHAPLDEQILFANLQGLHCARNISKLEAQIEVAGPNMEDFGRVQISDFLFLGVDLDQVHSLDRNRASSIRSRYRRRSVNCQSCRAELELLAVVEQPKRDPNILTHWTGPESKRNLLLAGAEFSTDDAHGIGIFDGPRSRGLKRHGLAWDDGLDGKCGRQCRDNDTTPHGAMHDRRRGGPQRLSFSLQNYQIRTRFS